MFYICNTIYKYPKVSGKEWLSEEPPIIQIDWKLMEIQYNSVNFNRFVCLRACLITWWKATTQIHKNLSKPVQNPDHEWHTVSSCIVCVYLLQSFNQLMIWYRYIECDQHAIRNHSILHVCIHYNLTFCSYCSLIFLRWCM